MHLRPTTMSRTRRWSLIALGLLAVFAVGVFIAYQLALVELRARVLAALGAQSEIGELRVSFSDIEITDLKINAPRAWPVKHALNATRVVITPDLGSVLHGALGGVFRINSIRIEGATLAIVRDRNGKLKLLPTLTEKIYTSSSASASTAAASASSVLIEAITLKDAAILFFDTEIRSPPLEVGLENVAASVTNLRIPELTGKSRVSLTASIKGQSQVGSLSVAGDIELATRDGALKTTLRDVEIAALEPYLIKAAETGVRSGTLDLDLTATMASQRLTAPGLLVLKNLALKSNEGATATFMGMPRDAVIDMIRGRNGHIEVPFKLEGNLNDPSFSLDAAFKTRLAIATASALGVTITGLISELGGLRDKGSAKEKADAVLQSLKRMIGK